MDTQTRKFIVMAAILGLLPVTSGCLFVAGGAAAVGGMLYVNGDLEQSIKADPQKVVAATEKAFIALKVTLVSKEATGLEGKVSGQTGDGKAITVKVANKGGGISKVSIRIGTFGDKDKSQAIMDEIVKRL